MIDWLTHRYKLDLLEEKLRETAAKKAPLSDARKSAIKKRLLTRVDAAMAREEIGFEQLAEQLEKLTLTVEPTAAFKQHARQDLLDLVTLRSQRLWLRDIFGELLARRKMWATVTACTILVTGTFGYFVQLPQVSAAKVSQIDEVRGTVYVERGEGQVLVENGFLVEEGDRIITEGDGFVDVMFVDDSLLTLGPDTIATVKQLWVDPENHAGTMIDVSILEGRAFAQVVNLSPGSSLFTLASAQGDFSVDRKAHFDLIVKPDETQVRVFGNLVDFEVTSEGVTHEGTLGPNLMMDVNGDLVIEKIEDVVALQEEDMWVQTNLESHSRYLERLESFYVERVEQRAGTLPGDSFYFLERGSEEVQKVFAFSEENKLQTNVALAEQRFSEAAVLMRQGRSDEALDLLQVYQDNLVNLAAESPEQEEALLAVLEQSKKMMEGFSLDDSIQEARAVVEETEILLVSDEAEQKVTHLETTADRLGLAFELTQIGAYELALQSLQDYQLGLSDVLEGLADLEMEARRQVVLEILDQKLRDLLMLKMISFELESAPESAEATAVQLQVDTLYTDTLYQLNTLVISLKERAVLELGTFLRDAKSEEDLQRDVLNRLKKTVPLDLEYIEIINDLEAFYEDSDSEVLLLENDRLVTSDDEEENELLLEDYRDDAVEQTGSELDEEAGV